MAQGQMEDLPIELKREALKLIDQEMARRNLYDFTQYTFGPKWRESWHHHITARTIDRWLKGEIKRLMISMPPRHTKSEFVSRRLPALIFGRDPDAQIIHGCHTARLAQKMSRDIKRVINSPRYGELFPETFLASSPHARKVPGRWTDTDEEWQIVGHRGIYRAAGVGQAISGEGATHAILDDLIKNREQAQSELQRDKIWDWLWDDLYTRLESDAAPILLTATRWHEDDPSGRLLDEMKQGGETWTVLTLRAEREDGDSHPEDPREVGELLWPEKFGRERAEVIKLRRPGLWSALFQQRPTPAGGDIFKREWFGYHWESVPSGADWLISWDTTFKDADSSDWVVGTVWWRHGTIYGLYGRLRARLDFPSAQRATLNFHRQHHWVRRGLVEDSANGPAIVSSLRGQVPGIRLVKTGGQSKVERARNVLGLFEAGQVLMPPRNTAPWLNEYIEEMTSFPGAAHDDQVDSTTQALNFWLDDSTYSIAFGF